MKIPRGRARWRLALPLLTLAALAALLTAAPARAQDDPAPADRPKAAAASLDHVPGDALFYGAMLRNREQIEAVRKSKAWAKLAALPVVQLGLQQLEAFWDRPDVAELKTWYEQDENRQLVALLGEMLSDEVFAYGGRETADFLALLGNLQQANQFAPLMGMLQGRGPQEAQSPQARARVLLQALADDPDRIHAPDLVLGFKLKDPAPARAQLARLDKLVQRLAAKDKRFEGRWTRTKGKQDLYALRLDGEMIPWDDLPWGDLEEEQGQFDKLKKKLRATKLTVSVGLRDGFLLVGLAETAAPLEAFGKAGGKRLAERQEFAPLAKFADRKLTGIAYASKEWAALQAGGGKDGDTVDNLMEMIKAADLTPAQEKKIKADLQALVKDFEKYMPAPAAALAFSFGTDRGSETYSYSWGKPAADPGAGQPLTILKQLGGAPLFFAAGRGESDPAEYKLLTKWIKIGWGYVEEYGVPRLPDDAQEKYATTMKELRPQLARLERVTGEMLLPALAEGQGACVLDAKLTSKQWHQEMPPAEKALPLLEPALVLGVSDPALLKKAAAEYRDIANKLLAVAGLEGQEVPPPASKAVKGGTLYYYAAPEAAGLDPQLALTAGLSEKWVALALSPAHATRLLAATPLKVDSPLLAGKARPHAVSHVRWAGLVDAAAPWVEYGLGVAGVADNDVFDIRGQVRTVLDVLKVFRSSTSITYTEGGATVTHSESIVRDIE